MVPENEANSIQSVRLCGICFMIFVNGMKMNSRNLIQYLFDSVK